MDKIYQLHDFSDLRSVSATNASLRGDYLCARMLPSSRESGPHNMPFRISGLVMAIIKNGTVCGEIDERQFMLSPNSTISFTSNHVLRIKEIDWSNIDAKFVLFTPSFLQDLNMDMTAINLHSMVSQRPDTVLLDIPEHSMNLLEKYFDLLFANASDIVEAPFAKNIARCLTQALAYQMLQIRSDLTNSRLAAEQSKPQTRQICYVQEFMKLLQMHHSQHRNASFYADKLCLSTKYLSHIIKDTTGRSAADWIGDFVVQEAKNLLRFSNKNVQQVAYELNFASQSSFGKYFKNITGMSPTEFKKT